MSVVCEPSVRENTAPLPVALRIVWNVVFVELTVAVEKMFTSGVFCVDVVEPPIIFIDSRWSVPFDADTNLMREYPSLTDD